MNFFKFLFFTVFLFFGFSAGEKTNPVFVTDVDPSGNQKFFDSFGRDRSAQPFQVGANFFTYSLEPEDFGTSVSGSGVITHDTVSGTAVIKSGLTSGTAKFRSHQYHLYQPDKAQEIDISIAPGIPTTGNTKIWGYKDDNDGLYFKLNTSGFYACALSSTSGSAVETCVESANFNGTDYDSKTLVRDYDFSKSGIFSIRFQWLGSGVANFYLVNRKGSAALLHTYQNPGTLSEPYMKRGALPLSFEQSSSDSSVATDQMKVICCSCISNGGEDPAVRTFVSMLPNVGITTNALEHHVVSFRLKALFKDQVNTTTVFPQELRIPVFGGSVRYRVYQDCTVTGGSWVDINSSLSAAEYTTSGTISNCSKLVEGGTIFGSTSGTPVSQLITANQGSVGFRQFKIVRKVFDGESAFSVTVQRYDTDNAMYDVIMRWGESR